MVIDDAAGLRVQRPRQQPALGDSIADLPMRDRPADLACSPLLEQALAALGALLREIAMNATTSRRPVDLHEADLRPDVDVSSEGMPY